MLWAGRFAAQAATSVSLDVCRCRRTASHALAFVHTSAALENHPKATVSRASRLELGEQTDKWLLAETAPE